MQDQVLELNSKFLNLGMSH